MMDLLDDHFPGSTKLAHGYEGSTYSIALQAIARGDGLRIGFEDRTTLPNGQEARSNAELVGWAVEVARACGREPASPTEARKALIG
jgi:uncharacterized protein (DUF849 family)